ncbi:YicC/YloC family endoribonuclease [Roseovarius sp. SYSU LYC5161]|uniref:YicC/YloC family endoribonuclease n=1 Tax=Roseovarius halophilus (ex Wu et al. 2025) TaxID=3376060 RepID=UPI00399A7A90
MTAFASAKGGDGAHDWAWELRGVNGKGLDVRLRVPDWVEGLEPALRARLAKVLARGNVTLSLKVQTRAESGPLAVNAAALEAALDAVTQAEARATARGMSLAPLTAADVLGMRGVMETAAAPEATAELAAALLADFDALLETFVDMRQREGAALEEVLTRQLADITRLTDDAAAAAEARRSRMADALQKALARVSENAPAVDEARVAQELAVLSVKSDVTEEIDRLRAHVEAARELLATGSPVGRKLDFLSQEFNREANTLCSKAQDPNLTAVGLNLKSVIDQMREQVQNVE